MKLPSFVLSSILILNTAQLGLVHAANNSIQCHKDKYGNKECTCPKTPITEFYPEANNDPTCDFFYLCHMGRAFKRKCKQQFAYHPEERRCLPRFAIPYDVCKPLVECQFGVNRYVEDKKDCRKYFLCLYGRYSHWSCSEGMYFDPTKEQCIKDAEHAKACFEVARKTYQEQIGFVQVIPKTSTAVDDAKAHMKREREKAKS